jgi:NAD(P)-dependent dehydrogenase (short-subunit alcohol dehydrogenase family)
MPFTVVPSSCSVHLSQEVDEGPKRGWDVPATRVIEGQTRRRRAPVIKYRHQLTGPEEIDRHIATNLAGSIHLIRAALPFLRRQGGGRIVQVSSEGGQIAYPGFSLYHATKWGIEDFVEAVAQEAAPFGIDFIIAEPGPTGTNFGANLVRATPMDAYDETPAGAVRRAITEGSFEIKGDAARTVAAILSAAESETPPLRLALGSIAYSSISQALSARLSALEAQRGVAHSADRRDP